MIRSRDAVVAARAVETEIEMEAKQAELTARERAYFEHRRAATEQGLSLTAYCKNVGINVRSLYTVRRELVEKGIVPRTFETTKKKAPKKPKGKFVAVRLGADGAKDGEAMCRLRHPSGWTIECRDWPQASWMTALVNGADHAAG